MRSITGRGWSFPPRLSDRDQIMLVQDDADIRQAIYIIINTYPGERVMRPEFGCKIHELIFAPANDQTAAVAERYVREALQRWEPRIEVEEITVKPGATEYGELLINIQYTVRDRHNPQSLVFPYYLTPEEAEES